MGGEDALPIPCASLLGTDLVCLACVVWSGVPNTGDVHSTLGQLAGVYRTMPKGGITDERGKCEDRKGATEELSTAICLCMYPNCFGYFGGRCFMLWEFLGGSGRSPSC